MQKQSLGKKEYKTRRLLHCPCVATKFEPLPQGGKRRWHDGLDVIVATEWGQRGRL
jgi:hypothetical protein